jgi:hypothetical protein
MELYFAASVATEEDLWNDSDTEMEGDVLGKDVDAEVFELLGFEIMQDVAAMSGDGSRGAYGQ